MRKYIVIASIFLVSCVPTVVVGLCALALRLGHTDGAVCSDPLLGDAGVAADFCYCNYCGGTAIDQGGRASPHYFRNSTSHGPCPGAGGPCTPIVFPSFDIGILRDAGTPPDMTAPADMALQPPPPQEPLPDAMPPDMR